jgi:hypothetical protein
MITLELNIQKATTNLTAAKRNRMCSDFHLKSVFGSNKQSKNQFLSDVKLYIVSQKLTIKPIKLVLVFHVHLIFQTNLFLRLSSKI